MVHGFFWVQKEMCKMTREQWKERREVIEIDPIEKETSGNYLKV